MRFLHRLFGKSRDQQLIFIGVEGHAKWTELFVDSINMEFDITPCSLAQVPREFRKLFRWPVSIRRFLEEAHLPSRLFMTASSGCEFKSTGVLCLPSCVTCDI